MTLVQRLVMRLPQRWAKAIQAESQSWLLRCPNCGHVQSVWDSGGVRWKAASFKKWVAVRCLRCRQVRMMPMERKRENRNTIP